MHPSAGPAGLTGFLLLGLVDHPGHPPTVDRTYGRHRPDPVGRAICLKARTDTMCRWAVRLYRPPAAAASLLFVTAACQWAPCRSSEDETPRLPTRRFSRLA